MSPSELAGGFRDLVRRLYGEDFTQWRRDNYWKAQGGRPVRPARHKPPPRPESKPPHNGAPA
jgi:hypothetical protein